MYQITQHYTADGKWQHVRYSPETYETLQDAENAIMEMIANGEYDPSSCNILDSEWAEDKRIYESAGLRLDIRPRITVNYPAIAKGVYAMFTEDEKTVMAFGMFPLGKMELAEKEMRRKCALLAMEQAGVATTDANIAEWSRAINKDVVSEFNHQLSVAILAKAKAANMLVV